MDTSVKLNGLVREHSSEAALVMMNMPPPVTPFVDAITGLHLICRCALEFITLFFTHLKHMEKFYLAH
jgi:hypothetical protein